MKYPSQVDYSDMQGLLRFGYGKLTTACFLLLRIDDVLGAANWIGHAPISSAELQVSPPSRSLQIAFTHEGLRRLGIPREVLSGFSAEFLSGMVGDDNRSRRLGDVGVNAPDYWRWGGQKDSIPDVLVMIYARKDHFEAWKESIQAQLDQSGFTLLTCLPTSDMDGIEPFGFVDGVSSPTVDWERRRDPSGDKVDYENVVMLGEFALGYPNEYGKYTTRPVVADASADLPDAEDQGGMKDIGRNGTYLVMRQLEQDVRGFWRYLGSQANNDRAQAEYLAELLVGRKMSGDPLLPLSEEKISGVGQDPIDQRRNRFTFRSDPNGVVCPLGAHIRRANPRNTDLPPNTPPGLISRLLRVLALDRLGSNGNTSRDLIGSTRFHRLLRRGREYGPEVSPSERFSAGAPEEMATGLNFICLNANIGRQFEFVQSAWIMDSKFDGLNGESDPLLGNREPIAGCPVSNFSLPASDGLGRQLVDVPRFVTVRGGAYFFLPGLRALRYLANTARILST